jgi:hypothetical protein
VGGVVGERQRAHPRVEELRGRGPRENLRAQELPRDRRGPVQQARPGIRVGVHEGARPQVVLRRPALDEVRGERERGTGEPDERCAAQLRDRARNAGGDGGERRIVERGQGGHVGGRAHGLAEHGTAAGHDVDVDSGQLEGNDDVAEEDARVDAVPTHGLQGDLARELRVEAGVEHLRSDAQLAVFGQRSARLPHEPHGRDRAADAPIGGDEGAGCRAPVDEGMLGGQGGCGCRSHRAILRVVP